MNSEQKTLPVVYYIILNLNGRDDLLDTLASVAELNYINGQTIVVDNGSTDGSPEAVRRGFPDVHVIETGKNLGFGGGNNVGMRYALEQGADWIFLLNNDTAVAPDLIDALLAAAGTDENIAALCPKIYYFDQPEVLWYAGGRISYATGIISHRGLREKDVGQYDRLCDTDYLTGCAFMVRAEVLRRVGLFDPVYHPAYVEDADLSVRIQRAGYRTVFAPEGKVWHKVSSYSGGGMTPMKTRLKVINTLTFFRRYARWYHWLTIPVFVLAATVFFVARELLRGNFTLVRALISGGLAALSNKKKSSTHD